MKVFIKHKFTGDRHVAEITKTNPLTVSCWGEEFSVAPDGTVDSSWRLEGYRKGAYTFGASTPSEEPLLPELENELREYEQQRRRDQE